MQRRLVANYEAYWHETNGIDTQKFLHTMVPRHLLQDAEIWTGPSSHMFRPDCSPTTGLSGIRCLSWTGFFFTIVGTYAGFALLLIGVFWSAGFVGKVKRAWALARR